MFKIKGTHVTYNCFLKFIHIENILYFIADSFSILVYRKIIRKTVLP